MGLRSAQIRPHLAKNLVKPASHGIVNSTNIGGHHMSNFWTTLDWAVIIIFAILQIPFVGKFIPHYNEASMQGFLWRCVINGVLFVLFVIHIDRPILLLMDVVIMTPFVLLDYYLSRHQASV